MLRREILEIVLKFRFSCYLERDDVFSHFLCTEEC